MEVKFARNLVAVSEHTKVANLRMWTVFGAEHVAFVLRVDHNGTTAQIAPAKGGNWVAVDGKQLGERARRMASPKYDARCRAKEARRRAKEERERAEAAAEFYATEAEHYHGAAQAALELEISKAGIEERGVTTFVLGGDSIPSPAEVEDLIF